VAVRGCSKARFEVQPFGDVRDHGDDVAVFAVRNQIDADFDRNVDSIAAQSGRRTPGEGRTAA
jgi:hypothetical protein